MRHRTHMLKRFAARLDANKDVQYPLRQEAKMDDTSKKKNQFNEEIAGSRQSGQVKRAVQSARGTEREGSEEVLHQTKESLLTILHSIGDAVIVTDKAGRIVIMNATAEQLTGWQEAEAAGRPLEEVFHIVNEETRRAVENPAARVLREGMVIGLANHTLLIAKDGREIPIAGSGAPIQDDKGEITGVVLLFRGQTKEREAQRAVQEAREYAESIVATVREPLVVLDAQLKVISANRSFYQTFKVDEPETVSRYIYELGNRQWDIPRLRRLLEKILPQNSSFSDFQVEHEFERIGKRTMLLNARRIHSEANKTEMILLAIEDISERKQAEERVGHLNRVLRTIRKVNQLIAREKERDPLLQSICETLIETRGYYNAWIALWDESGQLVATAEAGVGEAFSALVEQLERDKLPRCVKMALVQPGVVVTKDPPTTCTDCPLASGYAERSGITARLEHSGKIYGLLTISVPAQSVGDEEEQSLLREVSQDIAFALHDIELEEKRKQAEVRIRREKDTLALLNALNHAANRGDSLQQIIELFGRLARDIFSVNSAAVYLLSRDKKHLVLQNLPLPLDLKRRIEKLIGRDIPEVRIRLGAGSVYAEILQAGEPRITNDPATIQQMMAECTENKTLRKLVPSIFRIMNHRSVMSVPLVMNGEGIGLVDMGRQEPFAGSDMERFVTIAGQLTAIFRRRQSEEALRQSENRYRSLVDDVIDPSTVGLFILDKDFQVIWVSQSVERFFGVQREKVIGRDKRELIQSRIKYIFEDPEAFAGRVLATYDNNAYVENFECHVLPDGGREERWLQHWSQPIKSGFNAGGRVEFYYDITERKRAERELRESEERYRAVVENSHEGILIMGDDYKFIYVNDTLCEMLGYAREELIGHDFSEFLDEESRKIVRDRYVRRQRGEDVPSRYEFNIVRKKGGKRRVEISSTVVTDSKGSVRTIAQILDITERKRAETEIRRRAAHLEALNAVIGAAAVASDLPALLEVTLDRTLQALGLEMGGIWIGEQYVVRGLPEEIAVANRQAAQDAGLDITGPDAVEDWQQLAAGSPQGAIRPVMVRFGIRASLIVPVLVAGRRVGGLALAASQPRFWSAEEVALVEAVGHQLSAVVERLQLQDKTRQQARQIQHILDSVPDGVLLIDANHRLVLTNPAARDHLAMLGNIATGGTLTHLGERPLAELLVAPPEGLSHEVKTKKRVFEVRARPMDHNVETAYWVLVIHDVTQEREIRAELQQQARLAAVGQLAAGIAHDFNNIMAVIVLYTYMGLQTPGIPAKFSERLQIISQQAHRATDLIQQILDFSRRSVLERRPMDLTPFLKETVKMLERTIPESIELKFTYGTENYSVNADPTRVQQAIMNLVVNARDAMPKGGELRIALSRTKEADEIHCVACSPDQMVDREWVRITVTDSGDGIPPDVLPHIFEPFFTTKAVGKGTGLGLAQVYGIVKQHEGHLDVTTEVGKGTAFTIYLPALREQRQGGKASEAETFIQGQGETILVVEDEAALREALMDTLETLNYRVLEAANGREALNILTQSPERVTLVLSDLVMPEMGGQALFQTMRQRGLTQPVVMLSGYAQEKELQSLQAQGLAGWMPKPPSPEKLSQLLARVLNE